MNSTDQPPNAPKAEIKLSELQEEKVKLEIADLKRWLFKLIISNISGILMSALTVAVIYNTQIYQVERIRIDNEKALLALQRDPLNQEITRLSQANDALTKQNEALKIERDRASQDEAQMRSERDSATQELAALKRPTNQDLLLATQIKPLSGSNIDLSKIRLPSKINSVPLLSSSATRLPTLPISSTYEQLVRKINEQKKDLLRQSR